MIDSSGFTAILDANVLYPAPLRDFLLRLANTGLYNPQWTDAIQEEWIDNLLLNRPDLKRSSLGKTRDAMNVAFPNANITGHEEIIHALTLPDQNDRHVLAAAIKGQSNVIVTNNLKDFPIEYLKVYDIAVHNPDEFIINLIDIDRSKALRALKDQVNSLKNPPQTIDVLLRTLAKCGIKKSVLKLM